MWPVLVAQVLWGGLAMRHGRGPAWARGKWEGIRGFAAVRKKAHEKDAGLLEQLLRSNEEFIRATSQDTYWKLYFLLTGGAK